MRRILVIGSFAESLVNFRLDLLKKFLASGWDVHVAAPGFSTDSQVRQTLQNLGVLVHEISLNRTGTNPIADLRTLFVLWRLMRQIRPTAVLSYTIKPVLYGTLAAWFAGVPKRFSLITGLGFAFQENRSRNLLQAVVHELYRLALRRVDKVFFQNPDDFELFKARGLLQRTPSCIVNGSGIDLQRFSVQPLPSGGGRFLLIARLLGDKGVREYFQAAKQLKGKYPDVVFSLVGWLDKNPNAIEQSELDTWVSSGVIRFLGRLSDVRAAIADSAVFVLPSYREGTPRTVLEAMAMGRAIVTTDTPGCRETVVHGENGFLVPVKSVSALANAMEHFIQDPDSAIRMGVVSRLIAERKYDVHKVNAAMLSEMGIF